MKKFVIASILAFGFSNTAFAQESLKKRSDFNSWWRQYLPLLNVNPAL